MEVTQQEEPMEDVTMPVKRGRGRPRAACGTEAAYRRHRRMGEACVECRDAHMIYVQTQRAKKAASDA